jgi:hypothetical protein
VPTSSDTNVTSSTPSKRASTTRSARLVDRGRIVAALAGADHGLAVRARRQLGEHAAHVDDRLAAEREPVSQAGGRAGPR